MCDYTGKESGDTGSTEKLRVVSVEASESGENPVGLDFWDLAYMKKAQDNSVGLITQ